MNCWNSVNKIGTIKESSLHKSLKFSYCDSEKTEISVDGYVCDGQSDSGELIEVQTGSFGPLKDKIKDLSKKKKVRIVYPVILTKYIETYNTDKELLRKRKSPQKGSIWDLFDALIYAPDLCRSPRVTIELVLLDIVEKRVDDGKGTWRRKGITIEDRIPVSWHKSVTLKKLNDYCLFIPFDENQCFTAKDLALNAGIPVHLSQKCLYVLYKVGFVERVGKEKNAHVYKKKR